MTPGLTAASSVRCHRKKKCMRKPSGTTPPSRGQQSHGQRHGRHNMPMCAAQRSARGSVLGGEGLLGTYPDTTYIDWIGILQDGHYFRSRIENKQADHCQSVSQSVSNFTVPPRAHPSSANYLPARGGDVSARAHTCVAWGRCSANYPLARGGDVSARVCCLGPVCGRR